MDEVQNIYKNFEFWQEEILNEYVENDFKKLRNLIYPLLISTGGISQMEHDDYIGKSTDLMCKLLRTYDRFSDIPFDGFLKSCLKRRFITWANRDANRMKRKAHIVEKDEHGNDVKTFVNDTSLDIPIGDGSASLKDVIEDKNIQDHLSYNALMYMESLSETQTKIANMIMNNYSPKEIREELNISEVQYTKLITDMKSFEKRIILKHDDVTVEEDKSMQTQTREKSKEAQYSISSLIKKINGYTFRFDHPTQREKGRWTSLMKGNLISDILQDNPLPHLIFAEQIIDGVAVTWNLDGKQKSTNAYDFYNNEFAINKNVRRGDIEYQTEKLDEDGKIIMNNNIPVFETKTFDIRKKKFKDLPKELQERFCDYTFQCTQYLNCSDEDIEYHICRYNEGVRLNGSEKGMGEIGTKYAAMIKEIASMPFFSEKGGYKISEFNNGTINRVIAESIMAVNYLNEWRKKPEEICAFMKDKVDDEIFDNFTDMVERLDKVATDNVCEMFNSKDSFLYFGLFARFCNTGEDDKRFVEFMTEFSTQSLHKKEVNGNTYHNLCFDGDGKAKSTKDKNIVIPKIELLEKLMCEYLSMDIEEIQEEESNNIDFTYEDAMKNLSEDIEFYNDTLNDLTVAVDNNTKLLEEQNKTSLLAIVSYGYHEDVDLDDWIIDYFSRTSNYISDNEKNYLHMVNDLNNYILQKEKVSA